MDIPRYLYKSGLYRHLISPIALEQTIKEQGEGLSEIKKSLERILVNDDLIRNIYSYQSPKFIGGSCSLDNGTEPYNLLKVLGTVNDSNTKYLLLLNEMIHFVKSRINADWVGVYKKYSLVEGDTLVKMAYRGLNSRAEFPLYLPEFKSNNKHVGLTGNAIIINDMDMHVEKGGEYYECDSKVKSEVCLPIFDEQSNTVIGIIDVEDSDKYFFNEEIVLELIALCLNFSKIL